MAPSGDMITLAFDKGTLDDFPDKLSLHFQHATHAGHDQTVPLVRAPRNQYIGYLTEAIKEGVWHITLATDDWRLVDRVRWQNGVNVDLKVPR